MMVSIERDGCTMCALCWETCPQVFEESKEDGMSQIVEDFRVDEELDEGKVDDSFKTCVEEAAEGCPTEVIHID